MGGFVGKLLGLLIWATIFSGSAVATELSFFDFDGTIYHPKKTDKSAIGIYDSKFILFQIENRPNLLVDAPVGPREIEVSASDLEYKLSKINEMTEERESLLSPKEGRIGSLEKVTLSDGTVIIPGLYRIDVPGSFKYYREAPEGRNYLLEGFKRSEELEVKKIGTFRGIFWNHMVNLLSTPASAKQFGIITARGHSQREWKEFFDYLLEKGYIKNLPNMKNIHNINRAEYEQYGMGDGDSKRKVGLLKKIIQEMTKIKFVETDYRLHPNGSKADYYHSITFIDDNQKTLDMAYEELRNYAMRRWKVKIILSNSGLDHEVKKSRRPRSFVIGEDGTIRSATDFEVYGEPLHQNENKFVGARNSELLSKGVNSCSRLFN